MGCLEHGKRVFFGLLFSGFKGIVFFVFLSGKVAKVLKMFVFSSFGGVWWGGLFLFFWVWKVWVFLCFLFLFCVFVLVLFFCFVCFVFVFVVGCCCFCFCFCLFFLFLFVCCFFSFFAGFKGQVRWPFGLPHLALNPPFFVFFVFFGFPVFDFHGKKKPLSPPPLKKGIFLVHFSAFPFVTL